METPAPNHGVRQCLFHLTVEETGSRSFLPEVVTWPSSISCKHVPTLGFNPHRQPSAGALKITICDSSSDILAHAGYAFIHRNHITWTVLSIYWLLDLMFRALHLQFNRHLLNIYYMPGSVVGIEYGAVNKQRKSLLLGC